VPLSTGVNYFVALRQTGVSGIKNLSPVMPRTPTTSVTVISSNYQAGVTTIPTGNLSTTWFHGADINFATSGTTVPAVANVGSVKVDADLVTSTADKGLVLKSVNGTCYRVTVGNTGILAQTSLTCP
jgi:hypothetical protein